MEHQYSIVYMGTPEFAVAPLQKLVESDYKISAVVTVADKPSGRGLKLNSSPVKDFALKHNIPVLQPVKLSDLDFLDKLKAINADLFIVVAFRKLPESVWRMPPLGCFNLHASLLPQYRGAAPINHAIINGEEVTGVTTFFLNEEIDKGKIIKQHQTYIGPDETAGELHDRLKLLGAELVKETVNTIFSKDFKVLDQDELLKDSADTNHGIQPEKPGAHYSHENIKNAPKIFRNNCRINWQQPALNIHNFIRGLSPYPGAFSEMSAMDIIKELKVIKSSLTGIQTEQEPGTVIVSDGRLLVSGRDEYVELLLVQPSGKKVMTATEFLRGNRNEIYRFN